VLPDDNSPFGEPTNVVICRSKDATRRSWAESPLIDHLERHDDLEREKTRSRIPCEPQVSDVTYDEMFLYKTLVPSLVGGFVNRMRELLFEIIGTSER
jgi:hypothetical protein